MISSEPVSEDLLPIYNQLQTLKRCLIEVENNGEILTNALTVHKDYISTETQALKLELKDSLPNGEEVDMDDFKMRIRISVNK